MPRSTRTAPQPSPPPQLPEEDDPMDDQQSGSGEEDDSSEESSSDGEPVVPFLATREKRPNAGNRMSQLLEQEFAEEEGFEDQADDIEFEAKDEADIFDSDFGSTDSGGDDDDDEDAGERQLEREAKQAQKEARGKKAKKAHTPFIPSFARHAKQDKVASTSAITLDGPEGEPVKKRRKRVYDGFTVQRESSRTAAVAFKESVKEKLNESQKRKATTKQPTRKAVAELTQADLIMEALNTEDVNRASLLAFYAAEEDRRAQERIASMRYQITGPRVTWISRLEGVDRKVHGKGDAKGKGKEVEHDKASGMESGRRRLIEVIGEAGKEGWTAPEKAKVVDGAVPSGGQAGEGGDHFEGQAEEDGAVVGPPTDKSQHENAIEVDLDQVTQTLVDKAPALDQGGTDHPATSSTLTSLPPLPTTTSNPPVPAAYLPGAPLQCSIPAPPFKHHNSGAHARAYLILDDFEGTVTEEMAAYFGPHWGSLKPSRRVARTKPARCVITGRPARYQDPLTRTPYADLEAYKVLRKVMAGAFGWSAGARAYTGVKGEGLVGEVERARGGVEERDVERGLIGSQLGGGLGTPEPELFEVGALPPLPPLPPLLPLATFGGGAAGAQTMF